MSKTLLLMTCASGALVLMAGIGHAATTAAPAAPAAAADDTTNVTELVVTAEKRETSLQKVPVAVSVFTGAQRDVLGIRTVADVTNFAPGFTYDPANVHAFIRGIGRQSVNVTNDQRVSNYEDEFYVYSPYGLDKSDLFLSQTQIERGPQNVGGRNAEGGSIDMISVRPTDTPYGEVRATVGNYDTYNLEGAASGQIAPGLDARIAGFDHNQNDGYYTNVEGGPTEGNKIHEWYAEGQIDWKPTDQFEFWARAFSEGWDGSGDAGSRVGYANGSWDETNLTDGNEYVAGGLFVNPNFGYAAPNGNPTANKAATAAGEIVPTSVTLFTPGILNNPSASNPYNFADPTATRVSINDYNDFNYIATYHAPGFDVRYTGGVQGYNYHLTYGPESDVKSFTMPFVDVPGVTPAGATALTINPEIQQTYEEDDYWTAHDLTFESTTDSPLQWIAGGFAYYQHYNQPYQVSDPLQPQLANPLNDAGTALAAPNPLHQIFYYDYNFNVQSYGAYGQLSYKLTDQLKLTGNIRYSYDDKYGSEAARYVDMNSAVIDGYATYYGSATPALDITPLETCLSGNPKDCGSAAEGLGRGVASMGAIQSNGYATRLLGITSDAVTGGAGIEWTPTSDIFTYARYDRGYASPSFNAGLVLANPATQPEYINSYQVGYKESFGRSLLIDLAGFYYDYQDMQLPITVPDGALTTSEFINVPSATSAGAEAEAYWTPVRDLVVTFSYSFDYTDINTKCFGTLSGAGALTPAANATCLLDTNDLAAVEPGANPYPGQKTADRYQGISGSPLPDAPENKVAVNLAYTFHFEPGSLTLSGTYAYRGEQDGAVFNRYYDNAPGWDDVDLRALWKGPGDKYEVIGYMANVFNSLQYTVAAEGAGLAGSATSIASATGPQNEVNNFELNPPRTFGVEVRYKFF